jgi:c-di-GMP-binding flagellar brake protein YcgR
MSHYGNSDSARLVGLSFGTPMDEEPPQIEAEPGTELMLEVDGVYGHLKSELIGMRPGHYLIIRTPAGPPGFSSKLYRGNTILVRYLAEGTACGFQTHIMTNITEPEPLTFIECPRLVQEKTLRSARRLDTYLPCKVAVQEQTVKGNIIDLSRTGFRCVLPAHVNERPLRVHMGDPIVTAVHLEGAPVRLTGTVRNVNTFHAALRVGVHFEGLDKATDERVVEYLVKYGAEP